MILLAPLLLGRLGGITFCPTAGLTGYPCPGCGLTRAALALAGGDFAAAMKMHPLVFVVAPVMGGYLLLFLVDSFRRIPWLHSNCATRWFNWCGVSLAIVLFALWIARFGGAFGGPVSVDPWLW